MDLKQLKEIIEKTAFFEYARSSGPGGQNVNKRKTKARIRLSFKNSTLFTDEEKQLIESKLQNRIIANGELIIESQQYRSQKQNEESALNLMTKLIAETLKKEKPRKKTKIPRRIKEQRLEAKKKHSSKKQLRQKIQY